MDTGLSMLSFSVHLSPALLCSMFFSSIASLWCCLPRVQHVPHGRCGSEQLHPGLPSHAPRLHLLPAVPTAIPRCHCHPPHCACPSQHQHNEPHQQTGQVRLGGGHQGKGQAATAAARGTKKSGGPWDSWQGTVAVVQVRVEGKATDPAYDGLPF